MIQLKSIPKPVFLTEEKQRELTRQFKENNTSVWRQDDIKKALMAMSHGKCCYCECKIDEECKYLEVEHFLPKKYYPEQVVEWENLLPACKHCNTKKSDHDTGIEPIVHPVKDNPRNHLYLKNFQVRSKSASIKGKLTVEVLDLNDTQRLTRKRFEIGDKLSLALGSLHGKLPDNMNAPQLSVSQVNRLCGELRNLLLECCPSSEYSATAATVLLNDEFYIQIREKFVLGNIWSSELQDLEEEAKSCGLDNAR